MCKEKYLNLGIPEMKKYKLYNKIKNRLIEISNDNHYEKLIITINSDKKRKMTLIT